MYLCVIYRAQPSIIVLPFFNGTIEEGRAEFKEFLDLGSLYPRPFSLKLIRVPLNSGPVDLTREVPYEEMNSLQNLSVGHGQGRYLRGVTQLQYTPETAREAFKRMCELSVNGLHVAVTFEFYSLDKTNEVPNTATAFNVRGPAQNVLFILTWDDDEARRDEQTVHARQVANVLTETIARAEKSPVASKTRAYGNYGAQLFYCFTKEG